ncbi:hypothetical protein BJY00DRAFT_303066 [Aspergillus carlsbadensis]|nr:hypothetical protein BJY00DRAFT_303066 [Aspergillus carlsbadensis]
MAGLDPGGDVQFKPAACTVAEIQRYPVCALRSSLFACTVPTALDSDGNFVSSSETLDLAMSQETFSALARRYRFSGCLDAWRYRATSGCASRKVEYDDAGEVTSIIFTLSMRLSGSFASIISINHSMTSNTSTILALRVSPHDQRLLQQTLEQHRTLIGHALLIPTLLIALSLSSNMLFMQKIRHELSVVEKATGQHAWLQIPAADAPAHDSELSRLGHAAKIHVSLSYRRIEAISCFLELVRDSMRDFGGLIDAAFPKNRGPGPKDAYRQWVGDLEQLLKFRLIYGLLAQRDNMVGVSVAIESKKISEASKRDGSALKSLTVLTGVFFPATYMATLFSLPTFTNTPFWIYWVIVVPLTLLIFGSWSCWTIYRQRQIARETIRRDLEQDVELDPERAFRASSHTRGLSSQVVGVGVDPGGIEMSELVRKKNGNAR